MIGYDLQGTGPHGVFVLNDWLCDTSTWDHARTYLNDSRVTWALTDLRGYGRSRGQRGMFTVEEIAADVLELADSLGWQRFSVVGHSMSTLAALHLAQHHAARVERVVAITPPPPRGFGYDDATVNAVRAMALGDDARRTQGLRRMLGDRLSDGWTRYKVQRWRATSDAEAVAEYVPLFARRGLPDPDRAIASPVLVIAGEQDAPPMRSDALRPVLAPICSAMTLIALADCGHYPMQEMPPRVATEVERFVAAEHVPRAS
jgi:pimeloyl-ACP methyl ester carboxylesterase